MGNSAFGRLGFVGTWTVALLHSTFAIQRASPSPEFLKYWKSGLAELSSYSITTRRYGEPRKGQGVMVFVYEEVNSDTRIKVETPGTPLDKQVPVLKLNNILKFNTGVYDYSVMTSVFSGLSGPGVRRPFQPQKISFSAQEWCGQVYAHALPKQGGIEMTLHSYFEREGDSSWTVSLPGDGEAYYMDNVPILVRELDGEWLAPNQTREVAMFESFWQSRRSHAPQAFYRANIHKSAPRPVRWNGRSIAATLWTLSHPDGRLELEVEAMHPHKILRWQDSRGEKGELIRSLRKTYWQRNHNADLGLREELGLRWGAYDKRGGER